MRYLNQDELLAVSGGMYAQVMGCVAGGVGNGVSYVQSNGSNSTAAGGVISVAGGCAAGVISTIPGLGSSAMMVAFATNQIAAAYTPTAQEAAQGYRDTGTSCEPLPGSGALGLMIGGGMTREGILLLEGLIG